MSGLEVVAVLASAVACVQGTEILIKYSKKLYKAGKKMKVATKEISDFALKVEDFTNTIRAACISIKMHCAATDKECQPVMQYLISKNMIPKALRSYRTVRRRLLREIPELGALGNKYELSARLVWVRRRKQVEESLKVMESVKVTFLLLTWSLVLEGLRQEERTPYIGDQM